MFSIFGVEGGGKVHVLIATTKIINSKLIFQTDLISVKFYVTFKPLILERAVVWGYCFCRRSGYHGEVLFGV